MTNSVRTVYFDCLEQAQPMLPANIFYCPERKSVPILAI